MGGYTTDPVALDRCRAALADSAALGRAALHDLRTRADVLLGTGWQGNAATVFRFGWEQWAVGAAELLAALDSLAAALGGSAVDYAVTEAAVRASLARGAS
ncbi:MAG TPA: WXG100 family type VII secretion target [Jatrophihabitans sp.]|nr:WXG100 family type VII secretion target [Jatrophihabitans sp.]